MSDWLVNNMGKDYADSFEGQVFYALEALWKRNSRQKFRGFAELFIINLGLSRRGVLSPATEVSRDIVPTIGATILFYQGKELNKLWQENPDRVANTFSDAWKLLKALYPNKA